MCLARSYEKKYLLIRITLVKKKRSNEGGLFSRNSEESAIPKPVLSFVEMVLHGSDLIADTSNDSEETITISQLLHSNTKKKRNKSSSSETPFPLYLGLMVHSKTIKKVLSKNFLCMD